MISEDIIKEEEGVLFLIYYKALGTTLGRKGDSITTYII
jgi:hypothetical protein